MATHTAILREPIPDARAISWLPVGDSRHVVASLRPGGNRHLFVSQQTLARLNAIGAAGSSHRMLGLLIGALYQCPATGADYMIVTSLSDRAYSLDAHGQGVISQLKQAVGAQRERSSHQVLGWYFTAGAPGRLGADAEAAHRAVFDQPWSVALALGSRPDGAWGTFFRRDFGSTG